MRLVKLEQLERQLERQRRELQVLTEALAHSCQHRGGCAAIKKTETAVRLQCMGVVRDWEQSGRSIKQLLFRIQTTKFMKYWDID
jgi:hypothetical protein